MRVKHFYIVFSIAMGFMVLMFCAAKPQDEIQPEEPSEIAKEFVEYGSVNKER